LREDDEVEGSLISSSVLIFVAENDDPPVSERRWLVLAEEDIPILVGLGSGP
jgi:hypothetical protein